MDCVIWNPMLRIEPSRSSAKVIAVYQSSVSSCYRITSSTSNIRSERKFLATQLVKVMFRKGAARVLKIAHWSWSEGTHRNQKYSTANYQIWLPSSALVQTKRVTDKGKFSISNYVFDEFAKFHRNNSFLRNIFGMLRFKNNMLSMKQSFLTWFYRTLKDRILDYTLFRSNFHIVMHATY